MLFVLVGCFLIFETYQLICNSNYICFEVDLTFFTIVGLRLFSAVLCASSHRRVFNAGSTLGAAIPACDNRLAGGSTTQAWRNLGGCDFRVALLDVVRDASC
jgi:hypothetical protein